MSQVSIKKNWYEAIIQRNKSLDGQFVYGVLSTGVFCRPSCPSKQALKTNISFFKTTEEAIKAGFRECKRCKPLSQETNSQVETIQLICNYIKEHKEEKLSLEALGTQFQISPCHLQRTFKRIVGVSPHQYITAHRMYAFKNDIKEGKSVTEAIFDVGFSSTSRVYERRSKQLGMTPKDYQKHGQGKIIRYDIIHSELGEVLIAVSEKGICAIKLGDSAQEMEASFKLEFSKAAIVRDKEGIKQMASYILDCTKGKTAEASLPLDIKATAFQQLVWNQLKMIPTGETRTYSEIAKAIGRPTASRAVARACASNPVAMVIPCHRVIRNNGDISGYRWGISKKRYLLEQEAKLSKTDSF